MNRIWKRIRKIRWVFAGMGAYAFAFGGCISSEQLTDFVGTEIIRITSDIAGQLFLIFVQSISPFAAA